ncbi:MAG: hypothetical protein ACFFCS_17025 [Candidatus Hodarchaeota archaeon]
MSEVALIFNTVMFAVLIVTGIIAIIPVTKKNKQSYNVINTNFMWVLRLILVLYSLHYTVYSYGSIYLEEGQLTIGKGFKVMYLVMALIQVVQVTFTVYLYKKENAYTLPAVIALFIMVYTVTNGNTVPYIIFSTTTGLITIISFLVKGKKNRDGTLFGFGLLIFLIYFTDIARILADVLQPGNTTSEFFMFTGQVSGFVFLSLGTWGVYERHFLYDKEREAKIKSSWISQMIVKDSAKIQKQTYIARKMFLECPVCHQTGRHVASSEEVRLRYQNSKGIVKITIPEETICPHSISIYVDRKYSVRGYETPQLEKKSGAIDLSEDQIPQDLINEEIVHAIPEQK